MKVIYKKFLPVFVIFLAVNALVFVFQTFLKIHGFETGFLYVANLLLFLLSMAAFLIQLKAMHSANINVFLRGLYASLLLKIFLVIIGLAAYLFITRGRVNRPALFTSMALYILYTFTEVKQLLKISRKKPDA